MSTDISVNKKDGKFTLTFTTPTQTRRVTLDEREAGVLYQRLGGLLGLVGDPPNPHSK